MAWWSINHPLMSGRIPVQRLLSVQWAIS